MKETILTRIFFLFATADALGLPEIDGRVGHHGTHGCRMSCGMKGRHKPNSGHYYAAHLRPSHSLVEDSNHADFNFRVVPNLPSVQSYQTNLRTVVNSANQTDYEKNRKQTGISKPSILTGLKPGMSLPVPRCFSLDLMHLLFINLGELLVPLWRGTLPCNPSDDRSTWDWVTLTGDTWIEHGKLVAATTKYFPSSFHRPPRNPAEKISSGYKATEYFLYLFGLGPAIFRLVLPKKYWTHFCKLVHAVHVITQRRISQAQVREAHFYLTQFVEYEHMYYQRRMTRLHFCRPCLHTLLHTAPEVLRVGPGAYLTQFTMERAIGDLGGDIRQPSNIFGNLCQIALRQSQINALKTLCPELDSTLDHSTPAHSLDIGQGYILLRPRDRRAVSLSGIAIFETVRNAIGRTTISRWGRLQLPNGQVARSRYKEDKSTRSNQRISRNVKVLFILKFSSHTNLSITLI